MIRVGMIALMLLFGLAGCNSMNAGPAAALPSETHASGGGMGSGGGGY